MTKYPHSVFPVCLGASQALMYVDCPLLWAFWCSSLKSTRTLYNTEIIREKTSKTIYNKNYLRNQNITFLSIDLNRLGFYFSTGQRTSKGRGQRASNAHLCYTASKLIHQICNLVPRFQRPWLVLTNKRPRRCFRCTNLSPDL